jgi:hypothetical protein
MGLDSYLKSSRSVLSTILRCWSPWTWGDFWQHLQLAGLAKMRWLTAPRDPKPEATILCRSQDWAEQKASNSVPFSYALSTRHSCTIDTT